jgi:hypothetical protein
VNSLVAERINIRERYDSVNIPLYKFAAKCHLNVVEFLAKKYYKALTINPWTGDQYKFLKSIYVELENRNNKQH